MAQPGTAGQDIRWQPPTLSRVHQILRNPCYAGAFAFGRTGTKTIIAEGRIRRSPSRHYRSRSEWEVLILDHHAGYISWSEYLENRQTMAKTIARWETEGTGAIKKGVALLSGLLRCGRCGRKLQVGYSGTKGQVGRYVCRGRRDERGSGSCFYMGCLKIDQMVVEQLLEAIAPGGIEAALEACQLTAQTDQEKRRALSLALERAQYEAQRAKRQYDAVDPENRLVAGELEARWNSALQNVAELKARLDTMPQVSSITVEQKNKLRDLGADLPRLWNAPETAIELKKQILRAVIEEIVVKNGADNLEYHLQIHWAGGVHTKLVVPRNKSGHHARRADDKVVELVAELVKVCDDKAIAGVLNRLGYRTGQGNSWSGVRVSHFRSNHGLSAVEKRADYLTLEKAAQALAVSQSVVKTLIRKNILPAKQVVTFSPWVSIIVDYTAYTL